MKFLKFTAGIVCLYYFLVAAGILAVIAGSHLMLNPADNGHEEVMFEIRGGESFKNIARELEDSGLLKSRYLIYPLAWINRQMSSLRAGKYRLNTSMTPGEILDILAKGKVVTTLLTIPEGYNMFQIAREVEMAGHDTRKNFLEAARDRSFLKSIGIEHESAEGFLFPDSYLFEDNTRSREIIKSMVRRFFSVWERNGFGKRARELGLDMFSTLILASIVEEEAMLDREKPVIASVFHNRLRKNMPLQADPTVKYGILVETGINKKRLRTKDLRRITPYNTYRIKGLPAGPISNPGLVSIRAVLYPARTDYLFFVSMNNRQHKFSATLKEHNRAVRRYQLGK